MNSLSHAFDTARFLTHARIGKVITPEQLLAALRPVQQRPPLGRYAVRATVPNWLIERMGPNLPMATNHTVYPTLDQQDALLLATLQIANLQLRYVFTLSDGMAQAFLSDALDHQRFTLLFNIENKRQSAVAAVPFDLSDPQALRRHLSEAKRSPEGLRPAVGLTTLASYAAFQPSFIAGQSVDDVVAVLTGVPSHEELAGAASSSEHATANSGRPLH
jgi:hypothetical protein